MTLNETLKPSRCPTCTYVHAFRNLRDTIYKASVAYARFQHDIEQILRVSSSEVQVAIRDLTSRKRLSRFHKKVNGCNGATAMYHQVDGCYQQDEYFIWYNFHSQLTGMIVYELNV